MTAVRRGYVDVAGRAVHYRTYGSGPAVVMLHDSPRSSRLHLATMQALAPGFTVFALDTPGYGNSAPLDLPEPTIADFAAALGETLAALGLEQAPLYATHTSAKIALALAARGGAMPRLVLDGLSLPEQLAAPEFVAAYMRPFAIDDAGAYLAAEWSRTRDMLRWFPWFAAGPATRIPMDAPDAEWMADYGVDLFSAGPNYAGAYAAAMRWDPMPDLLSVSIPTLVAARSDDVLYGFLDRVPVAQNPALSIQRLTPDRTEWLAWLRGALISSPFLRSTNGEVAAAKPLTEGQDHKAPTFGYLDLPHGQVHWQRCGQGTPILALSAPTTLQALAWAEALAPNHTVLIPDLPGFGESDPLPEANPDAIADALAALIAAEANGRATVLALGLAAPLAARLAARHPDRVAALVIDGAPPLDPAEAARFGEGLCPEIAFDPLGGSHLHRLWHLLRDSEVQWPWHDARLERARRLPPLLKGEGLHHALTGVLKQPRHWGEAAAAALAVAKSADWAQVRVPTLVFRHADPAFAEAEALAAAVPGARLADRPDDLTAAAALLRQGTD